MKQIMFILMLCFCLTPVSGGNNVDKVVCGTLITIRWDASDDKGIVACSLFVKSGNAEPVFVGATSGADSISWRVPNNLLKNSVLKVRVYDEPGQYAEDSLIIG